MEPLRAAGYNERRCIIRDVLAIYGYIVALGTYAGPSIPSKSTVFEVLKSCVSQHPMLSTVILDSESENPRLAKVSTMDLDNHLQYAESSVEPQPSDEWCRKCLHAIHEEPWTDYEARPQWRVFVYPLQQNPSSSESQFQMAFACSHALADGMSLFAFHRSFLHALSAVKDMESSSSAIYEVKSERELLPALDRVRDMPISWSLFLPRVVQEFAPAFLVKAFGLDDDDAKDAWYGSPTRPKKRSPSDLVPTAIETQTVPAETLQRVLQVCRGHNARLTALMNYLTSRALAYTLQKHGQTYTKFQVETSINLRKCIPEAMNQMANYASAIEQLHNVSANFDPSTPLSAKDWETIRSNTVEFSKRSSTLTDQPIALLKYVSNFRERTERRALNGAPGSFGISNLGAFVDDRGSDQKWRITGMVFSQSADATGHTFNINLASVGDGPLTITVTWWPGMFAVEDEGWFANEFVTAICDQLAMM